MATMLLAIAASACGAAEDPGAQTDFATGDEAVFEDDDTPGLSVAQSPSGGDEFTFCVSHDKGLQATNAAWLAFMAANEYAHFGYIGPMLNELGFYNPNDPHKFDFEWDQCAADLHALRSFHKNNLGFMEKYYGNPAKMREFVGFYSDSWGSCSREWAAKYDGEGYPDGEFEKYLIQTHHPSHYVQFFSSGEYEIEGTKFESGSTQVMFARHSELPIAIVSFRGTEPSKSHDLIADGKAWKESMGAHGWPTAWGKVHAGFLEAFESVAGGAAAEKLRALEGTGVKIYITGHSLGGALATVLAARLIRAIDDGKDYKLGGLYTFGSPRVGDPQFAQHFMMRANVLGFPNVRFRNEDDIVTRVPALNYEHIGNLAYMTESEFVFLPNKVPSYGLGGAYDHNMVGYDDSGAAVSGYYRRLKNHLNDNYGKGLQQCNDEP